MIFGHFGIALMLKAKFYKRSLIYMLFFCFLPDIVFYILFFIQRSIIMPHPPYFNGLLQWILEITGIELSIEDNPLPFSHSMIIFSIFIMIALILTIPRKKLISGLIYSGAILSHFLFDFLLPDANIATPILYPLYPFNSTFFIEPFLIDNMVFWMVDLLVFIGGFFIILWAFSRNEERGERLPTL